MWTLASATITKYRALDGLNEQTFISHRSEAGKSNFNVLADSFPGEGSLPGLQRATFSLLSEGGKKLWCH